jgi:hypothetical protein
MIPCPNFAGAVRNFCSGELPTQKEYSWSASNPFQLAFDKAQRAIPIFCGSGKSLLTLLIICHEVSPAFFHLTSSPLPFSDRSPSPGPLNHWAVIVVQGSPSQERSRVLGTSPACPRPQRSKNPKMTKERFI